jgi:hypothetical protein
MRVHLSTLLTEDTQAHFDDCQSTEFASARSLGIIAIEMMQKGVSPATDEELVLKNPKQWSPEALNFIEIANWATLKEVLDVRGPLITLEESF